MGYEKAIDGYLVDLWYCDEGRPHCTVFWPVENSIFNASLEELLETGELQNTYGEKRQVTTEAMNKIEGYVLNEGYIY